MRNITNIYSKNINFWEELPQFTLIEPLKTLYKNDKSRSKITTSTIMWAIALIHHPGSDIYYVSDKVQQISKSLLDDENFDWKKYSEHISAFIDASMTQAQKSKVEMEKRLKNRDEFLSEQKYSFDYYNDSGRLVKGTADQLDAMEGRTHKLYENYFKIQKELETEEKDASRKGSKMESLSDSAAI